MIRYSLSALSILGLFLLSACETVKGAGQDIEDAGEAISQTAEEND